MADDYTNEIDKSVQDWMDKNKDSLKSIIIKHAVLFREIGCRTYYADKVEACKAIEKLVARGIDSGPNIWLD